MAKVFKVELLASGETVLLVLHEPQASETDLLAKLRQVSGDDALADGGYVVWPESHISKGDYLAALTTELTARGCAGHAQVLRDALQFAPEEVALVQLRAAAFNMP